MAVLGWSQEVRDVLKARIRNKASHEALLMGVQSDMLSVHTPVHTAFSSGLHAAPKSLPGVCTAASTPHTGKLSSLQEDSEV